MNELNEYNAWKDFIMNKPDETIKHREIYDKFNIYNKSIIKTGYLPSSIAFNTSEFLNSIITSIANAILNTNINKIDHDELKVIKYYFYSFFDLGIYGAISHEKSALSTLSLLITKSNKPFFTENSRSKLHSKLLKKLYLKGAIQAFQYSIESSQNIELLSLVLGLTSEISKYDAFFDDQLFFDISFSAIKRIISINKDIVSVKFLSLSLDSIQKFIPFSDEAKIFFVQTVLPILTPFITSENIEQRSNALSQLLKYAQSSLLKKEVVNYFSYKNRFSLFASVNLHYSISQKVGELMSIIISNSPTIGKPGIITGIWTQASERKGNKSFEMSSFYDTFIYIGSHLKSNLFNEFIYAVLNGKPSFSWFEMIDKLSTILSKRNGMKDTFQLIRSKLWSLIENFNEEEDENILSFRDKAKNSLIHMIGFNADESDLDQIKKIKKNDPEFFYLLLNSFLANENEIDEEVASKFLNTILRDLSENNHSSIMINDIKQLCNLCSSLSEKQLNLLMNSIQYFPDFFDFMSLLYGISILKPEDVVFIASKIEPQFITFNFYKFLKQFIQNLNPLDKCVTKLPFNQEELIWKFSIIDSPVRINFAKFLSRIYQMNDGKQLTDRKVIDTFLSKWQEYFNANKNDTEISNLLNLLWIFIDIYESNIYRDVNKFNIPLSIERTVNFFTVNAKCEKPEFNLFLRYPINYTIQSVVEELVEKYNKFNSVNSMNVYYNGSSLKRSATIKDIAEDDISITIELKVEKKVLIPHKYHFRTEIPSKIIVDNNWCKLYFEPLLKQGSEEAYEVIKLLPSNSKSLNIEEKLNDKKNPIQIFEKFLDIQFPYLFSYHFLLIYFNTLNNNGLLKQLVESGIVRYLLDLIVQFEPQKIFIEICDIFNYFVMNILKNTKFEKSDRNSIITTLLILAEKGFNLKTMKTVLDDLLSYNLNELKFQTFPHIRLLFHSNFEVRNFAMNVFKSIEISLNEYMSILRNSKDEVNETFIQSLADHITSNIDKETVYEITRIIMNLQTKESNKNGHFLKASLILFDRFLSFNFLNYERRNLVVQLIIERLITTSFSDSDLIAFEAATKCLTKLATTETYTLHKVLDELHSNRQPFTEYSIDGSKCSISRTGRVGLQRVGNTCYFNTIMQMFFAIKPIRHIIMSYSGDDNFLRELSKLFVLMKKLKARSINTEKVLNYLTYSDGSKVDISVQQDAAEFLQIIINKIEDVEKLFLGKSVDIYEGAGFRTEKEELFIILDLDVQNIPSLYESFKVFSKDVLLTGSNQFFDENSGKKIDVKKYAKIKEAPPFLIIHLKRFESIDLNNIGAKIDDIFEIPFEFDISPFSTQKFPLYRLTGVIVHMGTASNGHYICLSLTKNGWIKFDDVNSTFVDQKEVVKLIQGGTNQGSAYILFFTMETDVKSEKCEIKHELLEYADRMNKINNDKRLFCSLEYFNIIKELNNLAQLDYHDIVLRYAVDSLPFMEIRNNAQLMFVDFYSILMRKSKMNQIMLIEKFRFLDYSINFLREDLLLCPYFFIRKNTADLILANLNEQANPHQFLIIIFDMAKYCLNFPSQFDQVFYLIYSILKQYNELKENTKIQKILYKLLENDLIPFINNNPEFSSIDMTYILEIVNMYNVFKLLNKNNFLNQLFASDTCVDSIVSFIRLTFNDDEKQIVKFVNNNMSQISIQKFIPFCFFFSPDEAIRLSFQKLENKQLKVSAIRNPDEFDIACIFADLLSKCQLLAKYFLDEKAFLIWVPRLLLNPTSQNIRRMALAIFSYIVPHENLKIWHFLNENKKDAFLPKIPFDLKFASIKDNSVLGVNPISLCSEILNSLLEDDVIDIINDIITQNLEKKLDENICVEYFQLINMLLVIGPVDFQWRKLCKLVKLYDTLLQCIKNPFSGSLIYPLIIIHDFKVEIPQELFESGLKEIKSFSKYIDESHSNNFNMFLHHYFQLCSQFEPSKSFLNKFITYYAFSPEMTSDWSPVINYIKTILAKRTTKENQEKSEKIANQILKIMDSNFKNFANNNYSSLLLILNQIKIAVSFKPELITKIKRPTLSYLKVAIDKPQYLSINEIVKFACELNKGDFNKSVIESFINKYRYEIDFENMNRLKSFQNDLLNDDANDNNEESNNNDESTQIIVSDDSNEEEEEERNNNNEENNSKDHSSKEETVNTNIEILTVSSSSYSINSSSEEAEEE